jgi:hypothetical protein
MKESRQVRRARERAEATTRVHEGVLSARTVRDMWLVYAQERYVAGAGFDINDPAIKCTVEHAFYTGCGAMLDLLARVAPEEVSEDAGVEMLVRLHEELESYTKRQTS